TNHIERFNLTLRQRVSRLGRKTLSFSKKMANHIGAIWNFVHYYNAEIAPKLVKTTTC
ncbi:MAG: IS1 family transposase, partial [Deltaproteobacteria bacterium]|nr:IS1 family transposase [Deltaproteobacteria bacterium]